METLNSSISLCGLITGVRHVFSSMKAIKFAKSKQSNLEKIEDVELLRALEIGLKIKTINLKGDSFSVDVEEDYRRAKSRMNKDKFFKLYK